MDDRTLLTRYVSDNDQQAFEELVSRYMPLVYSSAMRRAGPSLAEDITQAVFIVLARKAGRLSRSRVLKLPAWLFKATRYAASEALRNEKRRIQRETVAEERRQMRQEDTAPSSAWSEVAPVLDEALDRLTTRDRQAVLLRYFRGAGFAEVGHTLNISENTATQRVSRALDRLRRVLARKGVALSGGALAHLLAARTTEAVPAGLASAGASATLSGTGAAAAATAVAIAEGAIRTMLMAQVKTAAVAGCIVVAATAGTITTVAAVRDASTPLPDALRLERMASFPLKYMARSTLPDGSGQFQLNSTPDGRSYFLRLGETVHGYRLVGHTEKKEARLLPGLPRPTPVDVSELVIERGGQRTTLVIDRGHEARGNQAVFLRVPDREQVYCLRLGDCFTLNDTPYELVGMHRGEHTVILRRLDDGREIRIGGKTRRATP